MIDTSQGASLIPIPQVPAHVPSRPHIATVWRWMGRGVRGVKLETVLIGGKRFTSADAIQRFIDDSTAAADGRPTPKAKRTRDRQRSIEAAERELSAAVA